MMNGLCVNGYLLQCIGSILKLQWWIWCEFENFEPEGDTVLMIA